MKHFTDLTMKQKVLFLQIENLFIKEERYLIKDFITVLGVLINKYKKCHKNQSDAI